MKLLPSPLVPGHQGHEEAASSPREREEKRVTSHCVPWFFKALNSPLPSLPTIPTSRPQLYNKAVDLRSYEILPEVLFTRNIL